MIASKQSTTQNTSDDRGMCVVPNIILVQIREEAIPSKMSKLRFHTQSKASLGSIHIYPTNFKLTNIQRFWFPQENSLHQVCVHVLPLSVIPVLKLYFYSERYPFWANTLSYSEIFSIWYCPLFCSWETSDYWARCCVDSRQWSIHLYAVHEDEVYSLEP